LITKTFWKTRQAAETGQINGSGTPHTVQHEPPRIVVRSPLEAELGIPVLDSAAIGVWTAIRAMGIDTRAAASLGRLFSDA